MPGNRYIPEWLYPMRREWMTLGAMEKLFDLQDKEGVQIKVGTLVNKYAIPRQKISGQLPHGYKLVARIVDVLPIAKAHGYTPIEKLEEITPILPPSPSPNEHIGKIAALLHTAEYAVRDKKSAVQERDELAFKVTKLEQQNKDLRGAIVAALRVKPISGKAGVYFLCNQEEVVYVGMSKTSVEDRVAGRANLVEFACMLEVKEAKNICSEETKWIRLLRPKGNTMHNLN